MKHLAKFAAMALALGLWSCSDDNLPGNGQTEGEGDFFATLTVQLPTGVGSRSETVNPGTDLPAESSDGYEKGLDNENKVNNVLVVLAAPSNPGTNDKPQTFTYVAHAYTETPSQLSETQPTYLLRFDSSKIIEQVKDGPKTLSIFVYCNAGANIIDDLGETFNPVNETSTIKSGGTNTNPIRIDISEENNFLMTSALYATTTLPSENDLKNYNKGNPWDLKTVSVERVAARMDFKRHQATVDGKNEWDLYQVKLNDKDPVANIRVVGMALFNEAQEFYVFPRMSANGRNTNIDLCGYETPNNWVVSPNESKKINYAGGNISSIFYYPTTGATTATPESFCQPQSPGYTEITVPSLDDNHQTSYTPANSYLWGENTGDYKDYKIWRYVTENTIPSPNSNQQNGVSTGVYFKAKIEAIANPTDGTPAAAIAAVIGAKTQSFYAYSTDRVIDGTQGNSTKISNILGTAAQLLDYCQKNPNTDLAQNFVKACNAGAFVIKNATGTITPNANTPAETILAAGNTIDDANTTNAKLGEFGFYQYYPDPDGNYYVYYPYYNRHNDNGKPYEMGRMEFATVRNNVYKLQVENITRIGLPGDVPPDPETPDESDDLYMTIKVKVLDWVVRINPVVF